MSVISTSLIYFCISIYDIELVIEVNLDKMLINNIYRATEGEGIFIGSPQVFVRFQGCAIGCLNCDSTDTWEFTNEMAMSMESVLQKISEESLGGKIKRVSITGGDPLHPKHIPFVIALIKELKARRYIINIEAAGTRVVDEVFDLLDYISFDVKTPSTGVRANSKLAIKMATQYAGRFQIKSVIESKEDFDFILGFYNQVLSQVESMDFNWCLTPAYNLGEEFPLERFQNVIDWNEQAGGFFRVIGQQHKWLFGPDRKDV
jgi:7-carboxy-7-deazaguanine synthase